MKKVTLFDVAERAGVSPAAVSRYLNKSGYVSAEKGELIRSAMEELGYYPAQSPRAKGIICLISMNVPQNSFYQMM